SLSGTVQLTANLGIPDLGSFAVGGSSPLADLVSGTHTAHLWVDGPTRARIALDQPSGEADWIRNGNDLWAWQSRTQQVVHSAVPQHEHSSASEQTEPTEPRDPPPTPATFAQRFLSNVDPYTIVSVRDPVYVAGRP